MKKMLGKRFMFLVALLMGLCVPVMAQTTDNLLNVAGLEPITDGETLFFLRNVGSGFSLSYGGAWGTQAIETQQAHYVVLEDNGDGTVAIANHGGYLASNELWMDRPRTESRWKLVPVEGYINQYNLVDDFGRVLSSIGDRSGLLVLKGDEGKALQRWIFTTVDDVRTEKMSAATKEQPVDVSSLIRTGAFDYADGWWPTENTLVLFENMMPYEYVCWGNDFTDVKKEYPNSGSRDWNPLVYNYCAILNGNREDLNVDYSLGLKLPAGTYHFTCEGFYKCFAKVTTQNYKSQYNYYNGQWSWTKDGQAVSSTISVEMDAFVKILLNGTELGSIQLPNKSDFEYDNGVVASQIFRDNDSYQQGIDFYLGGESEIEIQIVRGALVNNVETTGDVSPGKDKKQTTTTTAYLDSYSYTNGNNEIVTVGGNQICFDNFCLYYSGIPSQELPTLDVSKPKRISNSEEFVAFCQNYGYNIIEASLIFTGGVVGVLEFPLYVDSEWSGNLWTLGANQISKNEYNKQMEKYETAYDVYEESLKNYNDELQNIYANTDDYIIYKNYINANVIAYENSLGEAGKAEFVARLQELGVNANNINSREEYYEAIAKMEEALAYAKVVDAKEQGKNDIENADDHVDFSGAIFNHTFDFFTPENGVNKPKGWTYVNSNDTQVAFNANSTYNTAGVDGMYLFNTWGFNASSEAHFGGTPISQTVTDLPTGTYLLSALMTSDENNHLSIFTKDKERIFQVGHAKNVFDDYGMRFDVGNDGKAFLGVAGAKDDATCTRDVDGRWYKCDYFRLEYLPNGVLTLKETAERVTNIDDSFHGVKVERAKMSTKNWSTFVVPFSMDKPANWDVMEITGAEARPFVDENGNEYEDLNLKFTAAASIEAGKPYLVRLKTEPTEGTIRTAVSTSNPNVVVKTREFANPSITLSGNGYDYTVEFIGSYTKCTIPNSLDAAGNETGTNYYFLNGNKFYRSTGNGNVMKGFRGYFKVTQTSNGTNANAKGLRSLAMTRTETDIENVVDNDEVTVVAIYNVNGVKLESMQSGINILRMNNGITKKVMVK